MSKDNSSLSVVLIIMHFNVIYIFFIFLFFFIEFAY